MSEEVVCPFCGQIQETQDCPVSYWGTDILGDLEPVDCDCGETFFVREIVIRTYEIFKKGGGEDGYKKD